jgi:hypothetical protein
MRACRTINSVELDIQVPFFKKHDDNDVDNKDDGFQRFF